MIKLRRLFKSYRIGVAMQRMLQIYRNIIKDFVLDHPFYDLVISSVRIQFDEESHIFDFFGEVVEIGSQGRFSTAYTNTIEPSFPGFQKVEERFFGYQIVLKQLHSLR